MAPREKCCITLGCEHDGQTSTASGLCFKELLPETLEEARHAFMLSIFAQRNVSGYICNQCTMWAQYQDNGKGLHKGEGLDVNERRDLASASNAPCGSFRLPT